MPGDDKRRAAKDHVDPAGVSHAIYVKVNRARPSLQPAMSRLIWTRKECGSAAIPGWFFAPNPTFGVIRLRDATTMSQG